MAHLRRTLLSFLLIALPLHAVAAAPELFARSNLVAWCIVPFDAAKRGPEARAVMLERLGFRHFAYDYRAEHVPTFDAEIEALHRHGVELSAWWFPTTMNAEARLILDVLRRHGEHPQLWVMGGGAPVKTAEEQRARVQAESARIGEIAGSAKTAGCEVGLYNHGSWFGEPENQIAIVESLRARGVTNVGIVYNLHHGHDQIDRFAALLEKMKPHLLAINLNGMFAGGEKVAGQIVPLGQGDLDLKLLRIIGASGWRGPIGILNHTDEDAEARLRDNLEGLDWLARQLRGEPAGDRPAPKSWRRPVAVLSPDWRIEDAAARAQLPLYKTIPAAATAELTPANGFPRAETYRGWARSHGDNGSARFSGLTQINRSNVAQLEMAWTYHSHDGVGNIQCNPVIADGVLYAPTVGKFIAAVEASTGRELWRFKPEGRPAFRGLIFWPGDAGTAARLLFCAGQYLYALDPKTGQPVVSFGLEGRALLPGVAQGDFGAATAGPAIFERIIVVPGFEKDAWGFDVVSGAWRWTFHTVPQAGEFGYDTWSRTERYGANCWGGMALDEVRGVAYLSTGSAKENFIGTGHRGDNLFANCVVALDARTGKRLWHFQEVPHDIWDLDIPGPPILTSIEREGRRVDVVAAVTKIGNTLVLDRMTGKPIFPFRMRRAPVSTLPGEETAPYQPDVELPQPFAHQEFTDEDITDRSEEVASAVRTRVAGASRGWFQPFSEGKMNLYFGLHGGAEWTGACVDPNRGRLYVSANHVPWIISVFRDDDPRDDPRGPRTAGRIVYDQNCAACHGTNRVGIGTAPPLRGLRHRMTDEGITEMVRKGRNSMPAQPQMSEADLKALLDFLLLRDLPPGALTTISSNAPPRYSFNGYPKFLDPEGYPAGKPPWGTLHCLDLNTGKMIWTVPLGEHEELTRQGVKKTGTENFGGASVTAGGLVFCSGTRDGKIRAFDADTGAELWSARLPWTGSAPPAIYESNGREYVVVAATGGGKLGTPMGDAYVAFALKGR